MVLLAVAYPGGALPSYAALARRAPAVLCALRWRCRWEAGTPSVETGLAVRAALVFVAFPAGIVIVTRANSVCPMTIGWLQRSRRP